MFKRALRSHHWMAIGLDKWNDIESAEVPFKVVKKLRELEKLEKQGVDSDDEDDELDEMISEDSSSGNEGETDSLVSDGDSIEKDAVDADIVQPESEDESVKATTFEYCTVCPGKKFLTLADKEAHMKSSKHLKREKQQEQGPEVVTATPSEPKPSRSKQAPSENNRKARRAHLAREQKS